MCDCPAASIFSTRESMQKGWIIFAECKTENGKKITTYKCNNNFLFYITITPNITLFITTNNKTTQSNSNFQTLPIHLHI